jgi:hypothetical protein
MQTVIPGRTAGANPESSDIETKHLDSGLALSARPGMTGSGRSSP